MNTLGRNFCKLPNSQIDQRYHGVDRWAGDFSPLLHVIPAIAVLEGIVQALGINFCKLPTCQGAQIYHACSCSSYGQEPPHCAIYCYMYAILGQSTNGEHSFNKCL